MGFFRRISRTFERQASVIQRGFKRVEGRMHGTISRKIRKSVKKGSGLKKSIQKGIKKTFTRVPSSDSEYKKWIDDIADETLREVEPEIEEVREDPTGEAREVLKSEIYREILSQLDDLADEDEEDEKRISEKVRS